MNRRQLPIGIRDFRIIREEDFHYVNKTSLIRRLVDQGRYCFLSRPRRFGKNLLVDTLRELFEGNEPLFGKLDIHECRDRSGIRWCGWVLMATTANRGLEGDIIEQIRERGHADKYWDRYELIHLIGVACGRDLSPVAVKVIPVWILGGGQARSAIPFAYRHRPVIAGDRSTLETCFDLVSLAA